MYRIWPLAALAAALTLITAPPAAGAGSDPPAAAGWHGREIRDPLPTPVRDTARQFPRGWSAGGVGLGSGLVRPSGSTRVREVQRRLVRRGYRPGPIDGRFGPRTRAAVIWFQTKHGLPRTGRVDALSAATLRAKPAAPHLTAPEREASTSPRAQQDPRLVRSAPVARTGPGALALIGLFALGLGVILGRVLRKRSPRPAQEVAAPAPVNAPLAPERFFDVIGYVALANGPSRDHDLRTAVQLLGAWCEDRGWKLARVVHDVKTPHRPGTDRPGLAYALNEIAEQRAAGLVVPALADVSPSLVELTALLQWFNEADAFMIALDDPASHSDACQSKRPARNSVHAPIADSPKRHSHAATPHPRWDRRPS